MGKANYQDHKGAEYEDNCGSLDICIRDEVHQCSEDRHGADQIGDHSWRGHNIQMQCPMEIGNNTEVCAARAASQRDQNCEWTSEHRIQFQQFVRIWFKMRTSLIFQDQEERNKTYFSG